MYVLTDVYIYTHMQTPVKKPIYAAFQQEKYESVQKVISEKIQLPSQKRRDHLLNPAH